MVINYSCFKIRCRDNETRININSSNDVKIMYDPTYIVFSDNIVEFGIRQIKEYVVFQVSFRQVSTILLNCYKSLWVRGRWKNEGKNRAPKIGVQM